MEKVDIRSNKGDDASPHRTPAPGFIAAPAKIIIKEVGCIPGMALSEAPPAAANAESNEIKTISFKRSFLKKGALIINNEIINTIKIIFQIIVYNATRE